LFSGATVLGNGTLALILDIAATAARAGVKPMEEEVEEVDAAATGADASDVSFMVFEDRVRERTALPLDVVERIESVPLTQIEYAGGRALLQYRGDLLPLSDDGNVLLDMEAGGVTGDEALVTVLICANAGAGGKHRIGMVVRRVLDVSTGKMLERDEATDGMELALVKEKLTMVHHQFGAGAVSAWKEVA
jgi:two-component system, chemotaxis family, sensor kinase CheA